MISDNINNNVTNTLGINSNMTDSDESDKLVENNREMGLDPRRIRINIRYDDITVWFNIIIVKYVLFYY